MNHIRKAARRLGTAAAAVVLLLATTAAAASASGSALDAMVAAERAFSALSVERGMKEAFVANLADDGVVFRPAPVNGKQMWRVRANPAATLEWAPSYAEISGAGDLGLTCGPWEFRPADRNRSTLYGHFNSVWRREKDGAWKVAADIGGSHEKPAVGLDAVELVEGPVHPAPEPLPRDFNLAYGGTQGIVFAGGPGYVPIADRLMARAITEMMTAERSLVYVARNQGIERAYAEYAAGDVRICRDEMLPLFGVEAARTVLARRGRRVELVPHRHGMSSSRDLGYSYGLIIARPSDAARPDTVSYLHVWRQERRPDGTGEWKLALDVENEFGAK